MRLRSNAIGGYLRVVFSGVDVLFSGRYRVHDRGSIHAGLGAAGG